MSNDAKLIADAITSAGHELSDVIDSDGMFVVINFTANPKKSTMGHSVPPGKSLIEIIRDELDEAYDEYKYAVMEQESGVEEKEEFAKGLAKALGILRSTSMEHELEEAEERY